MRTRVLGRTGLEVSVVSLGSWLTFGGSVGAEESVACIRRAFELGVTLFDTANVYERGGAEEVLGRALAALPRGDVVVATKVFGEMGPGPQDRGLGERHVRAQCEASLRRLGVDVIDLYQCHRYDPDTPLEETCRVMDELVRAGRVRYWGVSEWTPAQMREAVELCEREGLAPPTTDQPRYSMLQREVEREVLPACAELGLGVLAFSPLAQGVLTGKYRSVDDVPEGSRATTESGAGFVARFLNEPTLSRVAELRAIADSVGLPLSRVAIAWTLRRPDVTTAIVGATSLTQIEENAAAAEVDLDEVTLERIDGALA
jgi:aryl-alcohol dehydrogenase-like predicted oxidoreductase